MLESLNHHLACTACLATTSSGDAEVSATSLSAFLQNLLTQARYSDSPAARLALGLAKLLDLRVADVVELERFPEDLPRHLGRMCDDSKLPASFFR